MGTGKISMNFFHTFCDPLNYFSDSIREVELRAFRCLHALSIFPNNTFSPFLHACMYENIQTVGFIPEKNLSPSC